VGDNRKAALDRPLPDADPPTESSDQSRPTDQLHRRLDRLPLGHPSSPYDAGDDPGERASRLRDISYDPTDDSKASSRIDRFRFTDAEWAEHVADVRDALEQADSDGLATDCQYTTDPDREQWTAERDRVQGLIVADLYEQAKDVPCDHQSIIAGGLGGAGKSTVLSKHADVDLSQYLTINPDTIKEEMARRGLIPEVAGLSPMEASDLVHEESSAIAKQLARKALADGKNVIWDITMSSRASTEHRIDDLRSAGYRVDGVFVDIPVETSVRRADARHREGEEDYCAGHGLGGRYVPHEVIRAQADSQWGSKNRRTFEEVSPRFDHWSRYDNSVDGRPPRLVDTKQADNGEAERKDR
jgi:predicted kinase